MPSVNFTARSVAALNVQHGQRVDYWDKVLRGFGLRVSRLGAADRATKTYRSVPPIPEDAPVTSAVFLFLLNMLSISV